MSEGGGSTHRERLGLLLSDDGLDVGLHEQLELVAVLGRAGGDTLAATTQCLDGGRELLGVGAGEVGDDGGRGLLGHFDRLLPAVPLAGALLAAGEG